MLLIAITWGLIFVLLVLMGSGTYALYVKILGPRFKTSPDLFQFTWLGYAALIGLLQIYSLVYPVNGQAVLVAFSLALVSCFFSYRYLQQCYKRSFNVPLKYKIFLLSGIAVIVTYLSYNSMLMPIAYDTELYHLNTVKWSSTYPAVPGIVNLHGRLAFNSSFHLFAALTNTWLWEERAAYVANGFLLLLVSVQWFAHIATIPRRGARLTDAFVVFTFPFLITTAFHKDFPSLSTDIPLHILCLVIVFELISIKIKAPYKAIRWYDTMNRKSLFSWFVILFLASVALSTKLGGVPLLLTLAPVSLILMVSFNKRTGSEYQSLRHLVVLFGLPVIVVAGLIARYIILSGWLIYPSPVGNLHLDWSASPEQVKNMLNWAMSWPRMPWHRPEEVLGGGYSYWFIPWFSGFIKNYPALLLLSSGIAGLLYSAFARSARGLKTAKAFPLFLSIAIGILGLVYWFVAAPEYRYGEVFFWIFAATTLTPLLLRLFDSRVHRQVITVLAMTTIVGGFKYMQGDIPQPFPDPLNLISIPPAMVPRGILVPVTINNGQLPPLIVYRPIGDEDRCGNSPLPCSPYVEEDSTIELRVPGDLRSGFRPTGTRTPDMHK